jgi:hypothetical protein
MRRKPYIGILAIPILLCVAGSMLAVDESKVRQATTDKKAQYHVVFREIIDNKEQKDWTDVYNAIVEVYKDNKPLGTYRGSTLPNFKPGANKPSDWQYSVVMATCAFPQNEANRFYTWQRQSGSREILRLPPEVPTVNVGSERIPKTFLSILADQNVRDLFMYATGILVHSGQTAEWRGSAGCLTIHPDDAQKFFSQIPLGTNGTLELNRGIHDAQLAQSYCY